MIASEMSTLFGAECAHRMVPLRNFVARSLSFQSVLNCFCLGLRSASPLFEIFQQLWPTNCFTNVVNTSFTCLGKYIAPSTAQFLLISRTRRFSPERSLASSIANLGLLVVHFDSSRTNLCSPLSPLFAHMRQRHIGLCTRCTLPSLSSSGISGTHWVFVQEMRAHAQLSLVRFDARLRVLSFFILHLFSLFFRIAWMLCMARFQSRDLPCCISCYLSWFSLVPRSPNCASSRFAVMLPKRLASML